MKTRPALQVRGHSRMEVPEVDAQFDAVGQCLQALGGILPVQAQILGEVVTSRRR